MKQLDGPIRGSSPRSRSCWPRSRASARSSRRRSWPSWGTGRDPVRRGEGPGQGGGGRRRARSQGVRFGATRRLPAYVEAGLTGSAAGPLSGGVRAAPWQHEAKLWAYTRKTLAEGKPHRVALNAVANKLCHVVYACLLDRRPYEARDPAPKGASDLRN